MDGHVYHWSLLPPGFSVLANGLDPKADGLLAPHSPSLHLEKVFIPLGRERVFIGKSLTLHILDPLEHACRHLRYFRGKLSRSSGRLCATYALSSSLPDPEDN